MALADVLYGLYAAVGLARGDRSAATLYPNTPEAGWLSFQAALYALPFFAINTAVLMAEHPEVTPFWHSVPIQLADYAIRWLLFPVLLHSVLGFVGDRSLFCRAVQAINYAYLLQMIVLTFAVLIVRLDFLPQSVGFLFDVALQLGTLVYACWVLMAALECSLALALGLVFLDLVTSLLLSSLVSNAIRLA